MFFEKIIVVGSGSIACDCVEILHDKAIELSVIESNASRISLLKNKSLKYELNYVRCENASDICQELIRQLEDRKQTLIVSANNKFIFPKKIVDMEKVIIINFHYSYLPDYRGTNIPTWVIWNDEPNTGITWHWVDTGIDSGRIIIQKKIILYGNETALDIVKQGMRLGKESFAEMIDDFLNEPFYYQENDDNLFVHYYKREQLPENGELRQDISACEIVKLLRAYDYGIMKFIPRLRIRLNENEYEIVGYEVEYPDKTMLFGGERKSDRSQVICREGYNIKLELKCK